MQRLSGFLQRFFLVVFLCYSITTLSYSSLMAKDRWQSPYSPAAVLLEDKIEKLPSEQLIGPMTENERRRISSEVEQQGYAQSILIGATTCVECHQDIAAQWSSSAHRFSSFNNPFYTASVEDLRDDQQGKTRSRWCASCHDPALLLTGAFDTDFGRNSAQAQAGLTCLLCHGVKEVGGRPVNGNYVIGAGVLTTADPLLQPDGKLRLQDQAAINLHKQNVITPRHRTAEFCGACHKAALPQEVNFFRFFRTQNDYDAWHDSAISGNAARSYLGNNVLRKCQDCHMPKEAATRGDLAAKAGMVSSHRFLAANTALPAVRKDEETIKRIQTFIANKVNIDLFALRRGVEFNRYIPALNITRPTLSAGEQVQLDIVVSNTGVGHTFPGGTLDINEAWVEFSLLGPKGDLLAINGNLKEDKILDQEAHVYAALFLDQTGQPIIRHNVSDIRTLVWRRVIPYGEADVVRYRFQVPKQLAGKSLTLRARLLWRKFNEPFRRFAYQANPTGFKTGEVTIPVLEICRSEVSLPVSLKSKEVLVNTAKIRSDEWRRFNFYGIGSLLQQDFDSAEYAFDWVRKIAPDKLDGLLNYARTKIEQGDTDAGLRLLNNTTSQAKEDARVQWSIAQAYFMRRQYQLAAQAFRDTLQRYPNDRQGWFMLAESLARIGNYQEALKPLEEVLKIDPSNPWAHYIKARSLEELQRADEAKLSFELYEKFRDDYFGWNRRWRYREQHPIDHNESYPIHVHSVRYFEAIPKLPLR
ncbi:MAG: tetratricopeptide repeat protein [Acidobacteriota bacterium]